MSALLIPLTKGFLGLVGISSFLFLSVRQQVEFQVQQMNLKAAEIELKAAELQRLKAVPEKK